MQQGGLGSTPIPLVLVVLGCPAALVERLIGGDGHADLVAHAEQ